MKPIRKRTMLLCAMDGCRLELVSGRYSAYYRCPEYSCRNRLSLKEAKKVYGILEAEENSGGLKRGWECEQGDLYINVARTGGEVKVYVLNRKVE